MYLRRFASLNLVCLSLIIGISCLASFPEKAHAGLYIEAVPMPEIYRVDSDADGVSDGREIDLGTDPASNVDSDGDGLSDDFERLISLTDHNRRDTDNDTLDDLSEFRKYESNPNKADTDDDGLSDAQEVALGTNPRSDDTDDDFIKDPQESNIGTSPIDPDSDRDGLKDGVELNIGTNPLDSDTDDGGVSDGIEWQLGRNPLNFADDPVELFSNVDGANEAGGNLEGFASSTPTPPGSFTNFSAPTYEVTLSPTSPEYRASDFSEMSNQPGYDPVYDSQQW